MKEMADSLSKKLGEYGIIAKDEIDTCRYGIELFLTSVVEIVSILFIAIALGSFACTLVFFCSFLPLRIYAGGYHADTKFRCYMILLVVYGVFMVLIRFIPISYYLVFEGLVVASTVFMVWRFAPIIHKKKTVSETERFFYRKISIKIMMTEIALLSVGMIWNPENINIFAFSLGQFAVTASMAAAFVKNKMLGGEKDEKVS